MSPIHWNKAMHLNMMDYLRMSKITVEVVNSQRINAPRLGEACERFGQLVTFLPVNALL